METDERYRPRPEPALPCPRCGHRVTYKGRGRRPVWCSARCRVEASIERRGNRIVGVEPRVVTVVPPRERLSRWEADRRQEIERTLTPDIVVAMVAREPYLLMKVLARLEDDRLEGPETVRQIVAQGLARTARALAPDAVEPAGSKPRGTRKRDASEWVSLLEELSAQLATGQLFSRDLPVIDGLLREVVDHYMRRVEERRR